MRPEPLAVQEAAAATPAARAPRLRAAVAVIVSRFPLITETFILREIDELERRGQPVRLVPLLRETPAVVHPEARPWMARALTTPFVSPAIAAAVGRRLRGEARRLLGLLGRVLAASWRRPGVLARNLALFPKAVYLAERLADEGLGHVHAHFATYPATVAWVISELTGISYSVTVHAHDLYVRHDSLGPKLEGATWVRTISQANRDALRRLLPRLPAERLRVIHVGVDGARHVSRSAPASGPAAGEPPTILAVAALKPYKGLPVLIAACDLLRRRGVAFRCEIVGEGPQRGALERTIRRLGLGERVRLLGARTQAEVADRLARAAVVAQPSVLAPNGQMEGIPVALMEAMAARRPVVASAQSGIPELVEDGVTGHLVPPGDAEALAAAFARLLADPAARDATLEAAANRVAREFSLAGTVQELLQVLDATVPAPPAEIGAAAAALGEAIGGGEIGVRACWRRRDSTVARLTTAGEGPARDRVLKVHRSFPGESSPPAARARREWDVLNGLAAALPVTSVAGEPRLGVPRPLALAAGAGALLMTASPGRALDDVVRRARLAGPRRWRACLADLRLAGAWLARFHAWGPVGDPSAACLERLLDETATLLAAQGLATTGVGRRLLDRGRLLAAAASPRPVVPRHGDFWPGNVFVGPDSCEVIDFEGLRDGVAAEDVAYFLLQLESYLDSSLLRLRRQSASRSFLTGYTATAPLDSSSLRLCRLAGAVRIRHHLPAAAPAARRRRLLTAALSA